MLRPLLVLVIVLLGLSGRAHTVQEPDADILVIGAGISGLSAALEAARGGATVLVVDMWSIFGGHAVMSHGGPPRRFLKMDRASSDACRSSCTVCLSSLTESVRVGAGPFS